MIHSVGRCEDDSDSAMACFGVWWRWSALSTSTQVLEGFSAGVLCTIPVLSQGEFVVCRGVVVGG